MSQLLAGMVDDPPLRDESINPLINTEDNADSLRVSVSLCRSEMIPSVCEDLEKYKQK